MDVSAHDGNVELADTLLHTADDLPADLPVDDGHDVDHPQGPSAHGRYVVDVDEDGEVAGVVGVRVHQGFHDAVSGEEDVLVADVDSRRILPLGRHDLWESLCREQIHDLVDGMLPGDAGVAANRLCNLLYRHSIAPSTPHAALLQTPDSDDAYDGHDAQKHDVRIRVVIAREGDVHTVEACDQRRYGYDEGD